MLNNSSVIFSKYGKYMNSQQLDPAVYITLAEFEKSNTPGVWSNLDKNQILADMRSRILDPFQVNQGGQPFCRPTSIFFELVHRGSNN